MAPPSPTFTVGGLVSGLDGSLALLNNGVDALTIDANGAFTFPSTLAANTRYAITVGTQPVNQHCTISNGTGSIAATVSNIVVACETIRVTASIGPAGGTLLGPDGVEVEFPVGALIEETLVGIARSAAGAPSAPTDNLSAGTIYEFTPHDIVFNKP